MSEKDFYQRAEDIKWRQSVESQLINLTSGQNTTNDRLDEIELLLDKLDKILRGNPEIDRAGMEEKLHETRTTLQKCHTVLFGDFQGQGSLLAEVAMLKRKDQYQENSLNRRWTSITAIAVATITSLTAIFTNLPWIKGHLIKEETKRDPVQLLMKAAKHQRVRVRHVKVVEPPVEEPPVQQVPEEQGDQ